MNEYLDRPYSDPRAEPVPWSRAQSRLADAEVAWIVTVQPDGRPHATPMVPVSDGGVVYFHTGSAEVKHANMTANPHVLVLAGDTSWDRGLDVALEGTVSVVTDDAVLSRLAQRYRKRWDGRWQLEVRDGSVTNPTSDSELVMFRVTPTRASAHDKGDPIGQTTYPRPPAGHDAPEGADT